jgi:Bifunctional DNA primase/polymerase, N-terminal
MNENNGRGETSPSRFEVAALELAGLGYYVFPCRPRGKEPLTRNGFRDATRDEQQILRWWARWPDANIGIACGASEVVVIDIDAKHGADPREVIPELGLEDYLIVWTGEAPEPSDKYPNSRAGVRGAHLYFAGRLPTCETELPGVELRGDGAYVLAPPSVHESGVPYET